MSGLFPETPVADFEALLAEPRDPELEILYPNYARCDRLRQVFQREKQWIHSEDTTKQALNKFHADFGADSSKRYDSVIRAGDALWQLQGHNFPLPDNTSAALAKDLKMIGHRYLGAVNGNGSNPAPLSVVGVRRLGVGLFLSEVQSRIRSVASGRSKLRLAIFSAHDTSIHSFLESLDFPVTHWPGHASSVIIELWKHASDNGWHVQLMLNDGVPGASGPTAEMGFSLDDWNAKVAPLIISQENYLQECALAPGTPSPETARW